MPKERRSYRLSPYELATGDSQGSVISLLPLCPRREVSQTVRPPEDGYMRTDDKVDLRAKLKLQMVMAHEVGDLDRLNDTVLCHSLHKAQYLVTKIIS